MAINLLDYLDRSAELYPDKLAVSDERLELSFSELRQQARRIGSYIASLGNRKNMPVAVEVDRASESIVLFLGVLTSGNFYIPIDSKMPRERRDKILKDLDPLVCLSLKGQGVFKDSGQKIRSYEELMEEDIDDSKLGKIRQELIDIDPAYMIYTSGSTGSPKGVVISHRMVMDFSDFLSESFKIGPEDILANQAPFYFDCSVKCIYQMLRNGSSMYIMRPSYFMFPMKAVEFFNEKKITTLLWATSGLNIISNSGVFEKLRPESLNKVFFSGEMLYARDYELWKEACQPGTKFINLYGPTEVTVDCSYYIIERDFEKDQVIPIGWPCRNMNIYLLDEDDQPVEEGQVGEICARGTGLSYGYYNNPEKTEEVFVQNPFNKAYRDIIYRTGDLGRYNEYGELVYISRKDNQVKHMGSRIELGEIEVAARALDQVEESVVFYDQEEKKIVLVAKTRLEPREILKGLKTRLPRYMTPNEILILEDFPYNRNGKIDRVRIKEIYFNGSN